MQILEGDAGESQALVEAFRGQEACICTVGNAAKDDSKQYQSIFAGNAFFGLTVSAAALNQFDVSSYPSELQFQLEYRNKVMMVLMTHAEVVKAAANNMTGPRRLWMMGGATVMAIPGSESRLTLNDLPIFAWLPFRYSWIMPCQC